MNDDFNARQRAITFRLSGRSASHICQVLGRGKTWLHKWWRRYLEFGAEGLYDLTRAHHLVATRIPPELERAILAIRRQLEAKTGPGARYHLIGASAILAELQSLHVQPQPSLRTIDRVLQRNGITLPRLRRPRLLPRQLYPAPKAEQSNDLHEVDLVGPIYLKGRSQRYYIWVCKDPFDGAVCLRLAYSRDMDEVLAFLAESWKTLGRPRQIQLDNAREIAGWGPGARYLSRVIRLCLYFGIVTIFIPPGEPQYNGSAENFNGWFQPRLLQHKFRWPGDLRRELAVLEETVNSQHVHARLGGLTPAQHRRRQRLQKLPPRYVVPTEPLPVAAGRVIFIRRVSWQGFVSVLSQSYRIGKRHNGLYVKIVLDTAHGHLTAYLDGKRIKRWPYQLLNK
jgi:putative transposase